MSLYHRILRFLLKKITLESIIDVIKEEWNDSDILDTIDPLAIEDYAIDYLCMTTEDEVYHSGAHN